ncbi:copper radical oxidase [Amanita thiersii Skay4041]|uniref:Copper radical oxidase n=1 Tax=Amanita thiersii Skay4041 TaxID=703135 RepID=A0A2A9NEW3_9AGAR|nr:copper radical oxidase [Amanita thiersii Skay4041]
MLDPWSQLLVPLCLLFPLGIFVDAQATLPPPGQPSKPGNPGKFEVVGQSLVSAQQLFLGSPDKVYFIDKVENNPTKINGHPAWASEWRLGSDAQRPMDVVTNSFCAGGNVMGNGTWVNVGGNQAVTWGGLPAESQNGGPPYEDPDGRNSIRLFTPCDDGKCDWIISPQPSDQRWYPTVETLEDGTLIIIGGCRNGGYVNDPGQDNPTYEFFPSKGAPVYLDVLHRTLPANLYPLTWLLPSGKLLIQSNWETVLFDHKANKETALDNVPDAVRVYPASAGTVMLPLTPANKYTATVLFCGGSNVPNNQWYDQNFIVVNQPSSASCVRLTPDVSGSYTEDDPLPESRSMVSLVALPNGKILALNGARMGTAGYGNNSWAIGQSFADRPVLTPAIYDPNAPAGQRWSRDGLSPSAVPRMYHSSALLLPDGSVFVSGSNPNADYTVGEGIEYPTEYRTERFYPSYYNERRPQPVGIPSQLSYGGPSFDIKLDADDLFGDVNNVQTATVVVIRPGFSTHAMNMGQRFVQLDSTYTGGTNDKKAILHVQQLPPNPAILAPGPAYLFVVVKGVPSVGVQVMVGSGQLGKQQAQAVQSLPASVMVQAVDPDSSNTPSSGNPHSSARASYQTSALLWICFLTVIVLGR